MTERTNGSDLLDTLRSEFGRLPAGARVPTIREVSANHSVSQFSVQRAFEALKEEGLIQSFVGRGSFISGGESADDTSAASKGARVLIVNHSMPSARGTNITERLQLSLLRSGHKPICVSYSDVSDLNDLMGKGGFDICVLQPRRSILPVEALALLKSKARHMIIEGRQLELMDVDVFLRNRAKSIAIALRHLRELGHTRIGLLTERLDAAAGYAEIENLYTQSYLSTPNQPDPLILRVAGEIHGEIDTADIGNALKEGLTDSKSRPSAFIVSGRFTAGQITEGFASVGLMIPGDISVVHLRATDESADVNGGFTTVGRSAEHVSTGIVDIVNWRLANPSEPAGLVLDDPSLLEGESSCAFPGD